MKMKPYIVYVKTNSNGYITAVNSSAFLTDTAEWTKIDSGYGDKYHHAQGNYFHKPIYTIGGAYCYKLVDGKPVECTAEEMQKQETYCVEEPVTPTQIDRLEAQVAYTAMMTDTLLEV